MRYFTKEWFDFCQTANPTPDDIAKMRQAAEGYRAVLEKQTIPPSLLAHFDFHDQLITGEKTLNDRYILQIESPDRNEPSIQVSFHGAKIKKRGASLDGCEWLYSELYSHFLGYEAHILFQKRKGLDLVELIVQCRDISIEQGE